jgi:hypothetical protein
VTDTAAGAVRIATFRAAPGRLGERYPAVPVGPE